MKRNTKNSLFEKQYNKVMNRLGVAVKRILENVDIDDIDEDDDVESTDECDDVDECNESYIAHLDEMARAQVNRAVNAKSYANVRDAIARRNYDENWAATVRPLSKFDDVELLHRYVSALLVFGKECPQTEAEIDEIGVFAEYAHALINDFGGTLDDIQTLYAKNDKVQSRKRVGTTRGTKGAVKATKVTPAEDFNFDEPEVVDDVTPVDDIEDVIVPEDDDDEFNIPAYDAVDDTDDSDIVDIEDMDAVTEEQYYDSNMNKSFVAFNDDVILSNGNQIGFEVIIEDDENDEKETITIFRDSFGKALEDLDIILTASIHNMSDRFYLFKTHDVLNKFFKKYRNACSDELSDEIDEKADDFYYKCFANSNTIEDIVAEIEKM